MRRPSGPQVPKEVLTPPFLLFIAKRPMRKTMGRGNILSWNTRECNGTSKQGAVGRWDRRRRLPLPSDSVSESKDGL